MENQLVEYKFSKDDEDYLLKPKAIMDKSYQIFRHAQEGNTHFDIDLDKIAEVGELVLEVTKNNYPTFEIPFHSRWGHFNSEKLNRENELSEKFKDLDPKERGRRKLDLVITSVLLDAGAGDDWSFTDPVTKEVISRSEGLALASYHLFCEGHLSTNKDDPMRVDAEALINLTEETIANVFQVSGENPLLAYLEEPDYLISLGKRCKRKRHFLKMEGQAILLIILMSLLLTTMSFLLKMFFLPCFKD